MSRNSHWSRLCGATAARLTPDQKVGGSTLRGHPPVCFLAHPSGVIFFLFLSCMCVLAHPSGVIPPCAFWRIPPGSFFFFRACAFWRIPPGPSPRVRFGASLRGVICCSCVRAFWRISPASFVVLACVCDLAHPSGVIPRPVCALAHLSVVICCSCVCVRFGASVWDHLDCARVCVVMFCVCVCGVRFGNPFGFTALLERRSVLALGAR